MPYDPTIDAIIASGTPGRSFRVLTTDLQWPAGDPPFPAGQAVTVPAMPAMPVAYAPATFSPASWTDCTALVSEYHYTQDAGMMIDQLSLVVPASWRSTLAPVFREMRIIVVQERYVSPGQDTGWMNRCWCLSDGYQERWEQGVHTFVVNAKDALKLAHLDVLGAQTGTAVYQPDTIQVGSYTEKVTLQLVADTQDAYEYALTVDGTPTGIQQPNWADTPAPQFWCLNARDKDNVTITAPGVPLAIGGTAVQVVFGEGVVRVGKAWAQATSKVDDTTDYSQGLNLPAGTPPQIVGVCWRFAHGGNLTDRLGRAVPADVVANLTVVASSPGTVTLSSPVVAQGLTLIRRDGTGGRYATVATGATSTTVTLADETAVVPVGAICTYGDANLVTDVLVRILLDCGYQTTDADAPLFIQEPTPPLLPVRQGDGSYQLESRNIALPPLVYHDTDGKTALEAIEELRRNGYVPPNYITRATASGQLVTGSVLLQDAGSPSTIPVDAIPANPGLQYDRTDLGVATRVVARGLVRQVEDATQQRDAGGNLVVTIADVAAADGGLPVPCYGLSGQHRRPGDVISGDDYAFDLLALVRRDLPLNGSSLGKQLRPWGWYYHAEESDAGAQRASALRAQWDGALLAEVILRDAAGVEAVSRVDTVELHVHNPWWADTEDWGGNRHGAEVRGAAVPPNWFYRKAAHADPQILTLECYDATARSWQPLWTNIVCPITSPQVLRASADQFAMRRPVDTSRLRIRCVQPFFAECGTYDESWYHVIIGVWLAQLKLWTSPEIRGIAELGGSENYGDELSAAPWPTVRQRMRSRTWVLPEAVPWASDAETVKWLALEWLKEKTRDLAPRQLSAIRPDVRLWDTVRFSTPRGEDAAYLVTRTDHTQSGMTGLTCVNYTAPYFEEE